MFGNTEILVFGDDGYAKPYGIAGEELLGKTRIWEVLEERYLPPYRPPYIPEHIKDSQVESYLDYKPKRIHAGFPHRETALNEIFELLYSGKLSRNERVVLASTFDNVVVEKSFLPRVIEALRTFTDEHNENLLAQADLLEKAMNDDKVWGVAWNQSTMHSDRWDTYVPYQKGEHLEWREEEANEEGICHFREPYNLNRDNVHWDMAVALNELPLSEDEVKYSVMYAIFPLRANYHRHIVLPKSLDKDQVEAEIRKEFHHPRFRLQHVKPMETVQAR